MLFQREGLGAGEGSIATVGKCLGEFAAVLAAAAHVAHVDERWIDDELIKSNGIIRDDLAEGLDEKLAARGRILIVI